MNTYRILHGDCLEKLLEIEPNSIDAIVTDPPYGLGFMGKKWDIGVPAVDVFAECLRVLKPGGHLLAFGGSRTYHRLAVAVEDAGFEIRDQIMWVYGSGFPKSQNVSKAIDKQGGESPRHLKHREDMAKDIRTCREEAGLSRTELAEWFPQYAAVTANWERLDSGFRVPSEDAFNLLVGRLGVNEGWRSMVRAEDLRRRRRGTKIDRRGDGTVYGLSHNGDEYEACTDAAKQWEGWGTALKPSHEPIVVARKPLTGTVAANVLEHGTGALNIDGCRIEGVKGTPASPRRAKQGSAYGDLSKDPGTGSGWDANAGRWPANLIHDGSDEATAGLAAASRYFYAAKASKKDRGEGNKHPTVKPTELMRYLVRLVTPPGGTVLDPFTGSGSTGKAAILEGFDFIGIEKEAEYLPIMRARLEHAGGADVEAEDEAMAFLD